MGANLTRNGERGFTLNDSAVEPALRETALRAGVLVHLFQILLLGSLAVMNGHLTVGELVDVTIGRATMATLFA